jgi:hypothetical protein
MTIRDTPAQAQERKRVANADRAAKTARLKSAREAAAAKKADELAQHAKRVAALYKSMREFEAHAEEKAGFELTKAAEKRAALEQALVEARELCKAAGENFKAFQEKYAPNYKRTRLYQVLAIADGRKTVEDVREENRGRKRRQRAGKSVRDKSDVTDKAAEGEESAKRAKAPAHAERTTIDFPENGGGSQPVLMASAEKPIEEVRTEFAALADDAVDVDTSLPPGMPPPSDEAPPAAEDLFAGRLQKSLDAAMALTDAKNNWPEMSTKDRNKLEKLVKELHALTHALVAMATPNKTVH